MISKKQGKTILLNHRYLIAFFSYILLYSIIIVNRFKLWEVDDFAIYTFYAVDFSFGFATTLLPGAVFRSLFGTHANRTTATIFMTIIVILLFFLLSYLLERYIKQFPISDRRCVLFLIMILLSGAYTFAIYTKTLGLLDTFWILFALIAVLFLEHKWLCYLTPCLCALMVFVHNGTLLCYSAFILVIVLYKVFLTEDKVKQKTYIFVFVLSAVATLAAFFFFAFNETKMICDIEDFHRKLRENGTDVDYYYDYALYGIYNGDKYIPDDVYSIRSPVLRAFSIFYYRFKLNCMVLKSKGLIHLMSFASGIVLTVPIYLQFSRVHLLKLKKGESLWRRFFSLVMLVQFPLTLIFGISLSEDITRWFSHSFLVSMGFILYVLYYEKDVRDMFFEKMRILLTCLPVKLFLITYLFMSVFTVY